MTLVRLAHCGRAVAYAELLKDVQEVGFDRVGVTQRSECDLPKVEVAGSIPVSRSAQRAWVTSKLTG